MTLDKVTVSLLTFASHFLYDTQNRKTRLEQELYVQHSPNTFFGEKTFRA